MTAITTAAAALNAPVDLFSVESLAPNPEGPNPEQWFRNLNTPSDLELLRSSPPQK
jgi:molybdopterin-guanine dinucleotide biosynthesis protein A